MSSPSSTKYKLLVAYEGTHYSGWQIQPNAISIQSLLEEALSTILRQRTAITGAGRTDSGVHALEQTAHFITDASVDTARLSKSLNGLLPLDIRIISIEQVTPSFHARYSAEGKIYRYHLLQKDAPNPFKCRFATPLSYPINLELLEKAARFFVGEKDFTSFSNEPHRGSAARNAVRTLKRLDIIKKDNEIILEFEGNGFLYKMVRNIVGTLLDVARGKLPIEAIPQIFEARDRKQAGSCAPAQGLFLVKTYYPQGLNRGGICENEGK